MFSLYDDKTVNYILYPIITADYFLTLKKIASKALMINIQKHINLVTSGFSFLNSMFTGNASIYGMPVSLGIELTNICNLKCPECPSGSGTLTRDKGFMSAELFDKILRETSPFLCNVNLYFQGESMMHPQFFTFLEKIPHLHSVLSTNGHFLSAGNSEKLVTSGLKELIISVDGSDQQSYSAYRKGGNLNKVKEGVLNVAGAKKKSNSKIRIEVQFLVNKTNEHQIQEMRQYARETDVSLRLKSMQIINEENAENWLPSLSGFRRYHKAGDKYEIKSSLPDRCARLWFNPVITWDGKVVPCCFDKNADHIMGDLNVDTFKKIWTGHRYLKFRKDLLSARKKIDICRNCTSGLNKVKC